MIDTDGSAGPTDYLRISAGLFDNPKLADASDECGPAIYVAWLHILCAAKRARHLGRIIITPVRLARAVGIDLKSATAMLAALERHRCLTPLDDRDGHYQIRNWSKWQSMTPAERVRKHRELDRAKPEGEPPAGTLYAIGGGGKIKLGWTGSEANTRLVALRTSSPVPLELIAEWAGSRADEKALHRLLSEHATNGEWFEDCDAVHAAIAERAEGYEVTQGGTSVTETRPDQRRLEEKEKRERAQLRAGTVEVFEHWKSAFGKTDRVVLDGKRKARIDWAVKTYGIDAAKQSICGYAKDDWDGRKKHHDLMLLFRDASHFEKGLELAAGKSDDNGYGDVQGAIVNV